MAKTTKENAPAAAAVCEKCGGYGYVIDAETNTSRRCDCGMFENLEVRARVEQANIPKRYVGKTLETFEAARGDKERTLIVQSAKAYAQGFTTAEPHGLLLSGSTGSGKTHIAVGILKEVLRRGFTGHYANFSDFLARIRASYSDNTVTDEGDLLELVDSVDLLVLDDVGAESTTDWVRDRLYLIINRRYESAKPIIITTNFTRDDLGTRIGPRTASRLYEMCDVSFPPFPQQDWRRANMR